MKKLAIGCGVVLLLTGVVAAGVAYYVFRQVSSVVTQFSQRRRPEAFLPRFPLTSTTRFGSHSAPSCGRPELT